MNFPQRPCNDAIQSPLVQKLKPIDHPKRFSFDKWACDRPTEDGNFGKKNYISR